jgi:hypothetical protein
MTKAALVEIETARASTKRRLIALTAGELLQMEIPKREMVLAPVLPSTSSPCPSPMPLPPVGMPPLESTETSLCPVGQWRDAAHHAEGAPCERSAALPSRRHQISSALSQRITRRMGYPILRRRRECDDCSELYYLFAVQQGDQYTSAEDEKDIYRHPASGE